MARQPTGQVIEDPRRPGVYGLRFRAYGKRHYQGLGKISVGEAEAKLRYLLVDIERGVWQAPAAALEAPAPAEVPTFHAFASEWFEAHKGEWRPKTRADYAWQLSSHLLPYFAGHRLTEISIEEVDRYRGFKVGEGVLSPASINKTITRLGQILELAREYKKIPDNPARGKNRRLKVSKPPPVWIDRPEHAAALLDAAGELDREAPYGRRHVQRRLMLATLLFAGLRLGELTALRWRDVDLAANRITVVESKTDAGAMRTVDLLPALRDGLTEYKASQLSKRSEAGRRALANELVFPTSKDQRFGASNVRRRVLDKAVERANERLAEIDEVPLPDGLTPHKLRHSFASLLVALGEDPGSVMDQMGHTDAAFTLRVYRHGMRRDKASRRAWRKLVGLADRAALDTEAIGAIRGDSGQPMGSESEFEGLLAGGGGGHGSRETSS
ncbi:MAG: site-specific integrase [Actinomycetota bacterium]|nr:site-specific integrase [Actinomycetota bacterium]